MKRQLPPMEHELHVILVLSNPVMFKSRLQLFKDTVERMQKTAGVQLYIAELAFGHRPFEVTNAANPRHIQVRGTDEVWLKENLINIALSRLPPEAKYIGWVDGDVDFVDPHWALESVHALQHYKVIQPWQNAVDLGPNGEHLELHKSFCYQYVRGALKKGKLSYGGEFGHPGYAWCARRETLNQLGGLIDWAILGSADHHMAMAFVGDIETSINQQMGASYHRKADIWQKRAFDVVQHDIGALKGTLLHHFHGKKKNRKYVERWQILIDNQYDPDVDIVHDVQGVIHLRGNKPKLRDDLRAYFRVRDEDSIDLE